MLASGKLRVLGKGDPDPYPDAVTVEARDLLPNEERGAVVETSGKVRKRRKPKPKK